MLKKRVSKKNSIQQHAAETAQLEQQLEIYAPYNNVKFKTLHGDHFGVQRNFVLSTPVSVTFASASSMGSGIVKVCHNI